MASLNMPIVSQFEVTHNSVGGGGAIYIECKVEQKSITATAYACNINITK